MVKSSVWITPFCAEGFKKPHCNASQSLVWWPKVYNSTKKLNDSLKAALLSLILTKWWGSLAISFCYWKFFPVRAYMVNIVKMREWDFSFCIKWAIFVFPNRAEKQLSMRFSGARLGCASRQSGKRTLFLISRANKLRIILCRLLYAYGARRSAFRLLYRERRGWKRPAS